MNIHNDNPQFAEDLAQLRTLCCSVYSRRSQMPKADLIDLGIQLQDMLARAQTGDPAPSLRQEYRIARDVINDLIASGIDLEGHRRALAVNASRIKIQTAAKREAARMLREKMEAAKAAKAKKDKKPKSKKKKSRPWLVFSPIESNRRKH